jgi:hypothetical protein
MLAGANFVSLACTYSCQLKLLSLAGSPWQLAPEEALLGTIQGVGAVQEPSQAGEHGQEGVGKADAAPLLLP